LHHLLDYNGVVGVWMVVLVDDENSMLVKRFRQAPPVESEIGRSSHEGAVLETEASGSLKGNSKNNHTDEQFDADHGTN
jgi:hypothetical protein